MSSIEIIRLCLKSITLVSNIVAELFLTFFHGNECIVFVILYADLKISYSENDNELYKNDMKSE